jgi:hypothetical protein
VVVSRDLSGTFSGTRVSDGVAGSNEGWRFRAAWLLRRCPVGEMGRAACTGSVKLLSLSDRTLSDRATDLPSGEECEQSTGVASPSTPALYWSPTGVPGGLLNRGSSPYRAASSTYWDSAEWSKIVSNLLGGATTAADDGGLPQPSFSTTFCTMNFGYPKRGIPSPSFGGSKKTLLLVMYSGQQSYRVCGVRIGVRIRKGEQRYG